MAHGKALCGWIGCLLLSLLVSLAGAAESREQRVPLHNGVLHIPDLSSAVYRGLNLPNLHLGGTGDVLIQSPRGAAVLKAVNLTLGRFGNVRVERDALILQIDPTKVSTRCEELSRAARILAAEAAPDAALRQARHWGLLAPAVIDPSRPLVILIHGLDSDCGMLAPMGKLLEREGYQIAYFCYPGDQGIDDSAAMVAQYLTQLHRQYPSLKIDLIAHSMGGLVARDYIEGATYEGGIDRLILVGTPNAGSSWSHLRFALSLEQHYHLWRIDPDWSPTWYLTEGFGEAGRDLAPNSPFLKQLSTLHRRDGVRYTIIAGTQHPASRLSSECFASMAGWFSGRAGNWWGLRQCKNGLNSAAEHYRKDSGESDGPVSVSSAKLARVSDIVLVPADHIALFYPIDQRPPAAWETIRNRLADH